MHPRFRLLALAVVLGGACASPRAPDAKPPHAELPPTATATLDAPAPEPAPPAAVEPKPKPVQLALGEDHSCLVYADGGVACWGLNRSNATGAGGDVELVPAPTRVPGVESAAQVSVGFEHSCAALRDGRLQCWGAAHHLVGDDPDPTDRPVIAQKQSGIVQLSGSLGELVARLGDGRVRMWESMTSRLYFMGPGRSPPESFCDGCELGGLGDVTSVASGYNTHCAVRKAGTIGCWGGNEYGQHGVGKVETIPDGTLPPRSPVKVKGISNATDVAVSSHACARLADGRVACWGNNDHGQVGDGTTKLRSSPVTLAGLDQVTRVAVAADSSCALRADGSVWCWGANDEGQLGDGTTTDRAVPVPVSGISGAVSLSVGHWRACVIRNDGDVWCWGWWDFARKTPKQRDEASRRPQQTAW